jgi:hypothetical protein
MKRLTLPSFLLSSALFAACGPAAEPVQPSEPAPTTEQSLTSIELVETALDAQLAATAAQAGVAVHALEINEPLSGAITPAQAWPLALELVSEPRLPWRFGANFTREQLRASLGTTLANDIERYINTGETYTAAIYGWSYPVAPDYCETGHFYVIVFNQARFVMTVERNGFQDC